MREFLAEFIIHSSIFLCFLIVFYLFGARFFQSYAIKRDIYGIVTSLFDEVRIEVGTTSFMPPIKSIMEAVDLQSVQDGVDSQNASILKTMLIGLTVSLCLGLALAFVLDRHKFLQHILHTLMLIPFFAVAEFIIVGMFLYSYVVMDLYSLLSIMITNSTDMNGDCNIVSTYLKGILPTYLWSLAGLSW